jgi:hypothetical protein
VTVHAVAMTLLSSRLLCCSLALHLVACSEDPAPATPTSSASASQSSKPSPSAKPSVSATAAASSAAPVEAGVTTPPDSGEPPRPVPSGVVEFGDSGVTVTWSEDGVECGSQTCPDGTLSGLGLTLQGCCDEGNVCGVNFSQLGYLFGLQNGGCEEFARPGSPDPSCPESEPVVSALAAQQGQAGGFILEPCCQTNGTCGFVADFSGFGFGCLDPDRFGQEGGQACDYQP